MALSAQIGSIQCRISGQRVLDNVGNSPAVEITWQGEGNTDGIAYSAQGTYSAYMRNGFWCGEQKGGIVLTPDGAAGVFTASGVGHSTADGGSSFRGPVYFWSDDERLAPLNGRCFVYEWEVSPDGTAEAKLFEWG